MADKIQKEYMFNNFIYKIVESEDIHNLLGDATYFERYLIENGNSVEMYSIPQHLEPVQNENVKGFSWDSKTTKLLLKEYLERKDRFRNPKIKKKNLWEEISQVFIEKGYYVNESMLDKKMRNLKTHYKTIKDNNKKGKTGRGRIVWEYFNSMEEIFIEDKTINCEEVLESSAFHLPSCSQPGPSTTSTPQPGTSTSEPGFLTSRPTTASQPATITPIPDTINPQPDMISPQPDTITPQPNTVTPQPSTSQSKRSGVEGDTPRRRKKTLEEIELRRVVALERVASALEENNDIQKDRNILFKDYLEYLKNK